MMGGILGRLHGVNGFQRYPKGVTISRYCIYETGIRANQRYFFYRFGNWTKARDTIDYEALHNATIAQRQEVSNAQYRQDGESETHPAPVVREHDPRLP
jgi:hypothetical protein